PTLLLVHARRARELLSPKRDPARPARRPRRHVRKAPRRLAVPRRAHERIDVTFSRPDGLQVTATQRPALDSHPPPQAPKIRCERTGRSQRERAPRRMQQTVLILVKQRR